MLSKTIHTLRGLSMLCAGALLASMILAPAALAQEGDDEQVRIEVKDGKVLVNGEVVKELENKDARIIFGTGGEGANVFSFYNRDGNTMTGFFSDDEDGDHEVREFNFRKPRTLEFKGEDGNWTMRGAFPDARRNFEKVLELTPMREHLEYVSGDVRFFGEGNREIMELDMKSRELARKIRRAESDDTSDLESELDELLNKIFDMKLEAQQKQTETLSTELSKLRERVQERGAAKEDVIQRRKRELLGERDAYDW